MIVRTFLPGERRTECEESADTALRSLRLLQHCGVRCWTADIASPANELVIVFWAVGTTGQVTTVIEHTMTVVGPEHATGTVKDMAGVR